MGYSGWPLRNIEGEWIGFPGFYVLNLTVFFSIYLQNLLFTIC